MSLKEAVAARKRAEEKYQTPCLEAHETVKSTKQNSGLNRSIALQKMQGY
ncbi:hypothetical protein KK120_03335 [Virgibacillus dakarensis]|nr:hypothetical protein [Virgibacillus dakarensis]